MTSCSQSGGGEEPRVLLVVQQLQQRAKKIDATADLQRQQAADNLSCFAGSLKREETGPPQQAQSVRGLLLAHDQIVQALVHALPGVDVHGHGDHAVQHDGVVLCYHVHAEHDLKKIVGGLPGILVLIGEISNIIEISLDTFC